MRRLPAFVYGDATESVIGEPLSLCKTVFKRYLQFLKLDPMVIEIGVLPILSFGCKVKVGVLPKSLLEVLWPTLSHASGT